MSVCLSVCLSVCSSKCITRKHPAELHQTLHMLLVFVRGVATGGISVYIPPQKKKNQSTLQMFMWLLVVFFSLIGDYPILHVGH